MATRPEPLPPERLIKSALLQQRHIVEQQALLLDAGAVGRHGARGDATHIGVVPPTGHETHQLRRARPSEHRRDHREIRQVGAAVVGVVGHHRIARRQRRTLAPLHRRQQRHHALPHRAEMHGDVGCIHHQAASGIEQGAGKIKPLLDVHRTAGLLQAGAHLLRDGGEAMAEQLQAERVQAERVQMDCVGARCCSLPLQQQAAAGEQACAPARQQQIRSGGLHDQGGTRQRNTRLQLAALPEGDLLPGPVQIHGDQASLRRSRRQLCVARRDGRRRIPLLQRQTGPDPLDAEPLQHRRGSP